MKCINKQLTFDKVNNISKFAMVNKYEKQKTMCLHSTSLFMFAQKSETIK